MASEGMTNREPDVLRNSEKPTLDTDFRDRRDTIRVFLRESTSTGVLPSFSRPQASRCSSRIRDSAAVLLAKRSGLFSQYFCRSHKVA